MQGVQTVTGRRGETNGGFIEDSLLGNKNNKDSLLGEPHVRRGGVEVMEVREVEEVGEERKNRTFTRG